MSMDPAQNLSPEGDGGGAPAERRAGSVQLRDTAPAASGVGGPDPANQSIADALKISFFLLKIGMLALGVLYALSGFQFVKEGEQGIRLLFGKIEDANVEPGFRYSWPYPLGAMERVETGANELQVNDVFWVEMDANQAQGASVDQLAAKTSLKPSQQHGSVLTADGNIAHARATLTYRRSAARDNAKNLYPGIDAIREEERRLVKLAAQRGIVMAAARVSIDELLKQTAGTDGTASAMARQGAQDLLDSLDAGITIDSLTLQVIGPTLLRAEFAKVQAAVSNAARATEEARLDAQRELNVAAGAAAPALVQAIDDYEAKITLKQESEAVAALAKVNEILDEGKARIGDKDVLLTGDASRLMSTARQYRTEIVTKRRGQLEAFKAKLEQFNSNPTVMVQREWTSSLAEFYGRDTTEVFMFHPSVGTLALKLNRDPEISREQVKKIRQKELDKSREIRNKEWIEGQFKTNIEVKAER